MNDSEQAKDIYRRVIAAINSGDVAALDSLIAPTLIDHNPVPDQVPGLAGFKQWMAAMRSSFPDLHGTIEAVLAEGDEVAARVTWRGTHQGDFLGIPATGRPVAIAAFHLVRLSDGHITDWWGTADLLGALQQMGARVVAPT